MRFYCHRVQTETTTATSGWQVSNDNGKLVSMSRRPLFRSHFRSHRRSSSESEPTRPASAPRGNIPRTREGASETAPATARSQPALPLKTPDAQPSARPDGIPRSMLPPDYRDDWQAPRRVVEEFARRGGDYAPQKAHHRARHTPKPSTPTTTVPAVPPRRRTVSVTFSCDPEDVKWLNGQAAENGMNRSEFIRLRLLARRKKTPPARS